MTAQQQLQTAGILIKAAENTRINPAYAALSGFTSALGPMDPSHGFASGVLTSGNIDQGLRQGGRSALEGGLGSLAGLGLAGALLSRGKVKPDGISIKALLKLMGGTMLGGALGNAHGSYASAQNWNKQLEENPQLKVAAYGDPAQPATAFLRSQNPKPPAFDPDSVFGAWARPLKAIGNMAALPLKAVGSMGRKLGDGFAKAMQPRDPGRLAELMERHGTSAQWADPWYQPHVRGLNRYQMRTIAEQRERELAAARKPAWADIAKS
jgi:hypothetical protein